MLVMLGSGLLLKIDEEKAHLPGVALSSGCVDVSSAHEVCVGWSWAPLSACRHPQGCRQDTCQAGIWGFHLSSRPVKWFMGSVVAGVVSAVFHLTHLVQWNK